MRLRSIAMLLIVSVLGMSSVSSIGLADGLVVPSANDLLQIQANPTSAIPEPSASPQPSSSPQPSEPSMVISPALSTSPGPTAIRDLPGAVGISHILDTQTFTNSAGLSVTQISVDESKANEILMQNTEQIVTIPIQANSDVVIGQLSGQTVSSMEAKSAVLEIKTENVTYTLPAAAIDIQTVGESLGQQMSLKDIMVNVQIAQAPINTVKIIEDTASKNNYQVVVKPVEFMITCVSGEKSVDVSKFNGYVERTVAIPEGVDPTKITTGIVLNPDGTFSHVPTSFIMVNNKYYAKINSLTNSVYAVLSSKVSFSDMGNHWAKATVEELGSKLIVSGKGEGRFVPDASVTRAEFATMVTKALGIYRTKVGKALFKDVPVGNPFVDAVTVASEYGLIQGDPGGTFRPNARITRQEAMVVLSRAMRYAKVLTTKGVGLEQFKDAGAVASWAKDSATELVSKGIMGGSNGLLRPNADISRAEVAAVLSRILKAAGLI